MLVNVAFVHVVTLQISRRSFLNSPGWTCGRKIRKLPSCREYNRPKAVLQSIKTFLSDGSKNGQLPLFAGIVCLGLAAANRLVFTPADAYLSSQSRSDELALVSSLLLVFSGILRLNVVMNAPVAVKLEGKEGVEIMPELSQSLRAEIEWVISSLLSNTPSRCVVVWCDSPSLGPQSSSEHGTVIARGGILGAKPLMNTGPNTLVELVLGMQKELTLADTKFYPARAELEPILPPKVQAVVLQPLGPHAVLVVASDTPRVYTPKDRSWISLVAAKLQVSLERELKLADDVSLV